MASAVRVAIVNYSCRLDDRDVVSGVEALQTQVSEHLCRVWNVDAEVFLLDQLQPVAGAWGLMLRDLKADDPESGRLPEVTSFGLPLANVFLGDDAPDQDWTHAASRDLANLLVDPAASRLVSRQVTVGGDVHHRMHVHDITAPCAGYGSGYRIGRWQVCDFVERGWFCDRPRADAAGLDHRNLIRAPFGVLPGERVFAYDLVDQRWLAISADPATGDLTEAPGEPTGTRLSRLVDFMDKPRERIRLKEFPCGQRERPKPSLPGGP